jgi:predicted MFS family arabinose efflux permease
MLNSYTRVLSTPGAWAFTSAGFAARLPIAMIGLGIVLYISGVSGSYARAGILTAAFALSAAIAALFSSRLIDRRGQHVVLPWLVLAHGLGLIAFVLLTWSGQAFVLQAIAITVAGASQPAMGSMIRARWVHVLHDPVRIRSAFALESILDELIFTIGPLFTTVLALQIALPLPLVVAAGLAVTGTLIVAGQRRTEPPPHRHQPAGATSAISHPGLKAMVVIAFGVGMVFGSYEVAIVAFAREQGSAGFSGVILAIWAGSSMFGGLWFGSRHWQISLPTMMVMFSALLMFAVLPTLFITNLTALAISSIFSGFAIAPALITLFSLTQRLVPQHLLTEGLTWSNSGLALGFAAGTSLGGIILDSYGTSWGFALTVTGGFIAVTSASAARSLLLRAIRPEESHEPAVPFNDDPIAGPGPTSTI